MMRNQRKLGIILSYLVILANAVVGLLYIPILLSYMTQSEYGLYRLMGSIVMYFAVMNFGIGTILTRFYTKYRTLGDEKRAENILALCLGIFVGIACLILLIGGSCYFLIDDVFGQSLTAVELFQAKKIYVLLLINIILLIFTSLHEAVIISHEKFLFLKSINLLQIFVQPVIVIQVMQVSPEAFSLVLIQTICNLIFLFTRTMYCFQCLKIKLKYHYFDKTLLKSMGTMSISMFIVAIVDQVFWQANQIILGSVAGTSTVAIYSIAAQIYLNYMPIGSVFMGVFLPKITEMVAQNVAVKDLSALFIKIGRIQFILLSAILTSFILYGKEFIILWAGSTYIEAYIIALIIMIPFTINLIQGTGMIILQAKNQYGFRARVYAIVGILNIILAIPIARAYGGIGCAMVTAFCYLIGDGIVMNIYYSKIIQIEIKEFWRQIMRIFFVTLLCMFFGIFIDHFTFFTPIGDFCCKLILYNILYSSIIIKFVLNEYEYNLLLGGINKIRKAVKYKFHK